MDKEIGVGLIGYGGIGKVHAYAYRNLAAYYDPMPAEVRLIGAASRSPDNRAAAEAAGFEYASDDYHKLLSDERIQLIDICTPNDLHAEMAIAALNAGKDVYCEKPLAHSFEAAREMSRALQKHRQRKFQVAFCYRFAPATIRARQLIADGFVGKVLSFRAEYLHSGYLNPSRPLSWRTQHARSGGGALVDLGSHAADLVMYLTGHNAYKVLATTSTHITERVDGEGQPATVDVDDHATVLVELNGGARGTIEASRIAMGSAETLRVWVRGDAGALYWDLDEPGWLHVYDGRIAAPALGGLRGWKRVETIQHYGPPAVFPNGRVPLGWMRLHIASQFAMIDAIAHDRNPAPDLTAALTVQSFLDACYRSADSGEWALA